MQRYVCCFALRVMASLCGHRLDSQPKQRISSACSRAGKKVVAIIRAKFDARLSAVLPSCVTVRKTRHGIAFRDTGASVHSGLLQGIRQQPRLHPFGDAAWRIQCHPLQTSGFVCIVALA